MIRPPKIASISENDYRAAHWPRIREAVAAALLGPWNVTFSSEELYRSVAPTILISNRVSPRRSVYNICTQRHSALLHQDLMQVVALHLQEEAARLASASDAEFFPRLHQHIMNFKRTTEILSTGFSYLVRIRIGTTIPALILFLETVANLSLRSGTILPSATTRSSRRHSPHCNNKLYASRQFAFELSSSRADIPRTLARSPRCARANAFPQRRLRSRHALHHRQGDLRYRPWCVDVSTLIFVVLCSLRRVLTDEPLCLLSVHTLLQALEEPRCRRARDTGGTRSAHCEVVDLIALQVLGQLRSQTASMPSAAHLKRSFNDSIMT